jgi:Mitochondrial biogenesis AIM24
MYRYVQYWIYEGVSNEGTGLKWFKCTKPKKESPSLHVPFGELPRTAMNAAKTLQRRHQAVIRWARVSAGYGHRQATTLSTIVASRPTFTEPSFVHHVCTTPSRSLLSAAIAATQPDDISTKNTSAIATTDESHHYLPSLPIDFDIAAKIEGEESHIATIELLPGETLRAESGAMLYMTDGVESMYTALMAILIGCLSINDAHQFSFCLSGDENGRRFVCF